MTFSESIKNRRSCYDLSAESHISDEKIEHIIEEAIKYSPTAFNSQTSRVVLLKGKEHKILWKIALDILRGIVPAESFKATEKKINSFAAAYGTVLYFEDQETVKALQQKFPTYEDKFPLWSEQHSGILQFVVWVALEAEGLGASVQHYNPLIDEKVREHWGLPDNWRLIAQMPFGKIGSEPGEKSFMAMEERFRIIG